MEADHVRSQMPEPYGRCEPFRFNITALNGQEETYNPVQALADIYTGFSTYFRCWKYLNQTNNPISDLLEVGQVTWQDVTILFLVTVLWTLARICITRYVFEPFTRAWGMRASVAQKFPECFFKVCSYFFLWLCAVNVTFYRGHNFFFNTLSLWSDCFYKYKVAPWDLRLMYAFEAGFYIHSSYATLFLDKWRRDSLVMLLHHFVTLTLICIAYAISHLKIGIVIFVLNDLADVFLELAKCLVYLKVKGARFEQLWQYIANISVSLFAILWFFGRTLGHLTKVWRSSSYGSLCSAPFQPPVLYLFFNILLGSLYLFYTYWLYLIIIFIWRLCNGQLGKDPDDIRDDEVERESQRRILEMKKEQTVPSSASWWLSSPNQKGRKAD